MGKLAIIFFGAFLISCILACNEPDDEGEDEDPRPPPPYRGSKHNMDEEGLRRTRNKGTRQGSRSHRRGNHRDDNEASEREEDEFEEDEEEGNNEKKENSKGTDRYNESRGDSKGKRKKPRGSSSKSGRTGKDGPSLTADTNNVGGNHKSILEINGIQNINGMSFPFSKQIERSQRATN